MEEEDDGISLGISDGDWDDYIEPHPDDWSSYKNELDEQEFEKDAVRRRSLKLEKLLRQDEKKRIARVKKRAMNYIGEIDVVEPDLEIGQICRVVLPDHTPPAMSRVRIHKVIILNEPDKIGLVKVAQVHAWELENTPRDLMYMSHDARWCAYVEAYNVYGMRLDWLKPTHFKLDLNLEKCMQMKRRAKLTNRHKTFIKHEMEVGSMYAGAAVFSAMEDAGL